MGCAPECKTHRIQKRYQIPWSWSYRRGCEWPSVGTKNQTWVLSRTVSSCEAISLAWHLSLNHDELIKQSTGQHSCPGSPLIKVTLIKVYSFWSFCKSHTPCSLWRLPDNGSSAHLQHPLFSHITRFPPTGPFPLNSVLLQDPRTLLPEASTLQLLLQLAPSQHVSLVLKIFKIYVYLCMLVWIYVYHMCVDAWDQILRSWSYTVVSH